MHSSSSYLKFYSARNWVIIENHLHEVGDLFEVKEQKKNCFHYPLKMKSWKNQVKNTTMAKQKHLFYLNLSKKKTCIWLISF